LSQIITGNCLKVLKTIPEKSINCCVTSPPYYGLRNYNMEEQFGLEETPEEFVENLVNLFREVKRVLKDDGTLWLNLGDSYFHTQNSNRNGATGSLGGGTRGGGEYKTQVKKSAFLKEKDLIGIPWRVALALQADGWYLRQDIIWHKPNPMPESVKDRCTKTHEYIFLLSKNPHYYYDSEAIREPCSKSSIKDLQNRKTLTNKGTYGGVRPDLGRSRQDYMRKDKMKNKRSVWQIKPSTFKKAHFATFPEKLIEPCILAGCPEGGTVLDPFFGAGTTGVVCLKNKRKYLGLELNPEYVKIAEKRLKDISWKPSIKKRLF